MRYNVQGTHIRCCHVVYKVMAVPGVVISLRALRPERPLLTRRKLRCVTIAAEHTHFELTASWVRPQLTYDSVRIEEFFLLLIRIYKGCHADIS